MKNSLKKIKDSVESQANGTRNQLVEVYDYHDEQGRVAYQKCRFAPKSFSWRRPDIKNPGKWINQGALKGVRRVPYRLPELLASNKDIPIVITEGEKDCDVLFNIGFVATTFGSKEDCVKLLKDPGIPEHFRGRIIWLVADKDCKKENRASGYKAFRKAAAALTHVCRETRLFLLPGQGIKDPHDLVSSSGPDKAGEIITAQAQRAGIFRSNGANTFDKPNNKPISSAEILACLDSNEDGDALLYQRLMAGRLCYDHSTGDWCKWESNCWKLDRLNEATALIQELIDLYSREAQRQSKLAAMTSNPNETAANVHKQIVTNLLRRISSLHTRKRKKDVLALAANGENSLGITGDEWDRSTYLLPCQNGIVDLRTGKFRQALPSDFIRKVAPVEWCGLEAPTPQFEKFVNQILVDENYLPDPEMVSFVQRLFGYAIIGSVTEHIFPVLWGQRGRNGKGTLLLALNHALGPFSGSISVETLLQSRYEISGAAPRPDLMKLRGARLIWCSESDQGQRLSVAQVKKLCGGDPISARGVYARSQIDFIPTHQIFFLTNHKPTIPVGSQDPIWQRTKIIPFNLSFVDVPTKPWERTIDKLLPDKLKNEASGILAWLVRGALQWQVDGLRVPKRVHQATDEYCLEEDSVSRFLSECCRKDPKSAVQGSLIYNHYKDWAGQNGYTPVNQTLFGRQVGSEIPKEKSGGVVLYRGIALIESA
ncbi:MAG: phage/plasmid primase, P4 family [Desulfomonilaceae bacterium]|jgi:putative DNA primase/helicase